MTTLPTALKPGRKIKVTLELREHGDGHVAAFQIGTDRVRLLPDTVNQLIASGHLEVVAHEWHNADLAIHPDTGEVFVREEDGTARQWRSIVSGDYGYDTSLDGVLIPGKVVPA